MLRAPSLASFSLKEGLNLSQGMMHKWWFACVILLYSEHSLHALEYMGSFFSYVQYAVPYTVVQQ